MKVKDERIKNVLTSYQMFEAIGSLTWNSIFFPNIPCISDKSPFGIPRVLKLEK